MRRRRWVVAIKEGAEGRGTERKQVVDDERRRACQRGMHRHRGVSTRRDATRRDATGSSDSDK